MKMKQELQGLIDRYVSAYRNLDPAGCVSMFSSDAILVSPYGPVATGHEEISALHALWFEEEGANKQMEIIEAGSSGNTAWCFAEYSEGEGDGEGYSTMIVERQSDGDWLIRMCSLNERVSYDD